MRIAAPFLWGGPDRNSRKKAQKGKIRRDRKLSRKMIPLCAFLRLILLSSSSDRFELSEPSRERLVVVVLLVARAVVVARDRAKVFLDRRLA